MRGPLLAEPHMTFHVARPGAKLPRLGLFHFGFGDSSILSGAACCVTPPTPSCKQPGSAERLTKDPSTDTKINKIIPTMDTFAIRIGQFGSQMQMPTRRITSLR